MYVLQESKIFPTEFQHKPLIKNVSHQLSYDVQNDSMVVITKFEYDFFDYAGPSTSTGHDGMYSGKSSVKFIIDSAAVKITPKSMHDFKENNDFIKIVNETKDYYKLLEHMIDVSNEFIAGETLKPIQIKLNLLNKEDFRLYSTLLEYMKDVDVTTLSAALRHVMNVGFRVHEHGIRLSPTNKIYQVKEMKL